MSSIRQSVRVGFGTTCLSLLFAACMPPIAFHDGLPAWTPTDGKVEGFVGYQRLSSFGADSIAIFGYRCSPRLSLNYFTPGVRVALAAAPPPRTSA